MKVAAAVVTYNRKDELLKNIRAILEQSRVVDKYYIIDNHGTDNTKEFLYNNGILDNDIIEFVYLPENIGGAGGFYTGLKMAYEAGYDYICLMDDDGRSADKEMMANLISAAEDLHNKNPLILLNSLVCGNNEILSFGLGKEIKTYQNAMERAKDNLIVGQINPFNGTLASRELIDKIGFPNKDFFIKGDEWDFYTRALTANAFVATVTNSNYYHPNLERKYVKILGKTYQASTEAPWKEYYRARNYTFMFKRDGEWVKLIRQNLRQILWAICYNQNKCRTVRMIIKGLFDGLTNSMGPRVKQ